MGFNSGFKGLSSFTCRSNECVNWISEQKLAYMSTNKWRFASPTFILRSKFCPAMDFPNHEL